MKYKYTRDFYDEPPIPNSHLGITAFERRLDEGWRLVCILKEDMTKYWVYWERPDD